MHAIFFHEHTNFVMHMHSFDSSATFATRAISCGSTILECMQNLGLCVSYHNDVQFLAFGQICSACGFFDVRASTYAIFHNCTYRLFTRAYFICIVSAPQVCVARGFRLELHWY